MFLLCSPVSDVTCQKDGSMTFRTETIIRQLAFVSGARPLEPGLSDELPGKLDSWMEAYTTSLCCRTDEHRLQHQVPENWMRGTEGAFRQHAYFG
jgi:hypothetical protein